MALFSLKTVNSQIMALQNDINIKIMNLDAKQHILTDLFCEPDSNDWHSSNDRVWIFLSGRVDCVIGSNNKCQVEVQNFRVHFIHLMHNVIRNSCFGQKNVQLARHTTLYHKSTESICTAMHNVLHMPSNDNK